LRAASAGNLVEAVNVAVGGLFLALVAAAGARLAVDGTISVGELVAAVGVAQFLVGPLERIGFSTGLLARARASAGRAAAVLAAPPVVRGGEAPAPAVVRGALRVRVPDGEGAARVPAAGGGRADGARPGGVLVEAAPGELLGVVIRDPAVASGLLDVLARRADGEASVDGVALASLSLADAQRLVLVADHEAELFEGSVAENVAPGRGMCPPAPAERNRADPPPGLEAPAAESGAVVVAAEDGRLEAVLAAAGADELVRTLPGGLGADVGERGGRLSGGQRQRVALARALAADAPVLVLHDPTTAVDAVTEARVAEGVRALRRGRTTVLVCSSPALLAACDRVVLLDGDEPAASGTHHELAADPRYREVVLT
jgi:putative ABC transport system ATP-binding protein